MVSKWDVNQGRIVKTQIIEAPLDRVFKAFTTKDDLAEWLEEEFQIDARVGGKFKMGSELKIGCVEGEFLEIIPNEKLVFTWKVKRLPGHPCFEPGQHWSHVKPAKVAVEFKKAKKGTKITLAHEGLEGHNEEYDVFQEMWDRTFMNLLKYYLEHTYGEWEVYAQNNPCPLARRKIPVQEA